MKKTGLIYFVWLQSIMALLLCGVSFAKGDIEAGKSKTQTCVACHGKKGISDNPIWPNLAGQHASYLLKQLMDYKKGEHRYDATMAAMVAPLTQQDMEDLAAYYASLPKAEGTAPKKYIKPGEQLYRGGDISAHITACIACHGPNGMGNSQANFLVLSGQHAPYVIAQLQLFREGKRSNDLNAIMRDISKRMSKEDMESVAYYIQGLH